MSPVVSFRHGLGTVRLHRASLNPSALSAALEVFQREAAWHSRVPVDWWGQLNSRSAAAHVTLSDAARRGMRRRSRAAGALHGDSRGSTERKRCGNMPTDVPSSRARRSNAEGVRAAGAILLPGAGARQLFAEQRRSRPVLGGLV